MLLNYLAKRVNNIVRRNFYTYVIARKYARFFSRFLLLEEGFNILSAINLNNMKGKILLDCGSNDGTSIEMILQYFPDSQIIAFDPIVNIPFSRPNVIFHNLALGSKSRKITVYTPVILGKKLTQFSSINKSQVLENLQNNLNINKSKISFTKKIVNVSTIDSFAYDPFFIKIDVEGYEYEVLRGAKNTIKKFEPLVVVEINSLDRFVEIKHFFDKLMYELVCVKGARKIMIKKSAEFQTHVNNYVFVPRSFLKSHNSS